MTGFTLGKASLAKLEGVHPDMVKVVKLAITYTTQDFSVHEGVRTKQRQANLVKTGASRTMNSKHIKQADGFSHAVDLLPWGDFDGNGTKEVSFHWGHFYAIAEAMRKAAKELGIRVRWGGCWCALNDTTAPATKLVENYVAARKRQGESAFIDGPHFELEG